MITKKVKVKKGVAQLPAAIKKQQARKAPVKEVDPLIQKRPRKFWDRTRYSAQKRFDSIRKMASICSCPKAEGYFVPEDESSSNDQSVQIPVLLIDRLVRNKKWPADAWIWSGGHADSWMVTLGTGSRTELRPPCGSDYLSRVLDSSSSVWFLILHQFDSGSFRSIHMSLNQLLSTLHFKHWHRLRK